MCLLRGGFDGRDDGLDADFAPIGIASDDVFAFAFEENAESDVQVSEGWKPDFVVDPLLLECERGSLVDRGEKASEFNVVEKTSVESGDLLGVFIDPQRAAELLGEFFRLVCGPNSRVRFEIKGQKLMAFVLLAAWVDEPRDAKKCGNT